MLGGGRKSAADRRVASSTPKSIALKKMQLCRTECRAVPMNLIRPCSADIFDCAICQCSPRIAFSVYQPRTRCVSKATIGQRGEYGSNAFSFPGDATSAALPLRYNES